jgi:ribosome-associated toxin RatA of RatAB toxin-antitoxin module
MASAEFHEVMNVDRDKLFTVISRYEDYPQYVVGCSSTQVDRTNPAKVRATYNVNMMKEISYTLDHIEDAKSGKIEWTLVKSDFMKTNIGKWELKAAGAGKTDVSYKVELEFKFPVPGMILNRIVKGSLAPMVKSFVDRANKNGA